nr:MAG TPA: hypothetical protein [Caudoviricetes sp.]
MIQSHSYYLFIYGGCTNGKYQGLKAYVQY